MATSLDKLASMEETSEGGYLPQEGILPNYLKYLYQTNMRAANGYLTQEGSHMEEEKAMGLPLLG